MTAGDGNYSFVDLDPGHYLVVVTPPDGMAPTGPGAIVVAIGAGDDVTDADVGLATPAVIPFDLALQKDLLDRLVHGGTATWRLTVTNNGMADSPSPLTVTDVLPAGVTFISADDDAWSCAAEGPIVTCALDESLAMGDSVTLDLLTAIDAEPGAVVDNEASVAADGSEVTLDNNNDGADGIVAAQEEPTTTTSTTSTSTTSTTSTTPPSTDGDPTTTTSGTLPVTGSSSGLLALIGLALLGAGALLVALRRRLDS